MNQPQEKTEKGYSQENSKDVLLKSTTNMEESYSVGIPQKQDSSSPSENLEEIKNWDDMDLDPSLLRGIYAYGYEKPSPIQSKAIVPMMSGRDLIAQAQSGTGKTATFTIGALTKVDTTKATTQVLILSPTRELSTQTANVVKSLGSMITGLTVLNLVGGKQNEMDDGSMRRNQPHIITGCPGRVYDMLRRNYINASSIRLFILDEADEMLSVGFKDQIYNIFQFLPNTIQVALFSATLPDYIENITSKFMRNPIHILVKSEALTLEGIMQYYVSMETDNDKYDTLKDLFSFLTVSQCIIYCNSIQRVITLHQSMLKEQFPVCCIHSNMMKEERDESFQDFRSGKQRILISSNITARGIDIQQVSIVINFDLPKDIHSYLHRIGRSGRWGRKGTAINFITKRDIPKIREIEQFYATEIKELPSTLDKIF
jgi:translation initiation factor 4A